MRRKVNQMNVRVRELFTNKAKRLIVEKQSLTLGCCFVEKRERIPIFAQDDLNNKKWSKLHQTLQLFTITFDSASSRCWRVVYP